jgi:hypothetical protein
MVESPLAVDSAKTAGGERMDNASILAPSPRTTRGDRRRHIPASVAPALELGACLELLLLAFEDIASRDDIHQAAERLRSVLRWIDDEIARAAGDPIFSAASACPPRRRIHVPLGEGEPHVWRSL